MHFRLFLYSCIPYCRLLYPNALTESAKSRATIWRTRSSPQVISLQQTGTKIRARPPNVWVPGLWAAKEPRTERVFERSKRKEHKRRARLRHRPKMQRNEWVMGRRGDAARERRADRHSVLFVPTYRGCCVFCAQIVR